MKYYPRLDSIRALAAFLVILNHWTPANTWFHKTPLAMVGVTMFFVLSGFLISFILFKNVQKAYETNQPKSKVLKTFFIKRLLRIVPIYFIYLFVVFVFRDKLNVSEDVFLYLLTYTSNLYMYYTQEWMGFLSPLWTLSVEEQFYLVFPLLYLFLSRKLFLVFLAISIVAGILLPIIFRGPMMEIHTYSCLDSFGLGILYAYFFFLGKNDLIDKIVHFIGVGALVMLVLHSLAVFTFPLDYSLCASLFSVSLIAMIVNERPLYGLDVLFDLALVQFIGKISYGIYLYHTLVGKVYNMAINKMYANQLILDSGFWKSFPIAFSLKMITLLVVSMLSWYGIEKRILNYKDRELVL